MKRSKTFCTLPWVHLACMASGKLRLCCNSSLPLKNYNLSKDTIGTIWNSQQMREVRRKMLAGESVSACKSCYMAEEQGRISPRQQINEWWLCEADKDTLAKTKKRIETSAENGFKVEGGPMYYDLRLGNLCNLKCRSCNSESSSAYHSEGLVIAKEDARYERYWSPLEGKFDWYANPEFWKDLRANLENVRLIYLTGGEPTLIKESHEFLKECVNKGIAGQINVQINTNCTVFNEEFYSLLSNFKQTFLALSIDGVGKVNDYLRAPAKWATVKSNVDRIMRLLSKPGNPFMVIFSPVVQATNILYCDELFDFFEELIGTNPRCSIMPNLLINPDYLAINSLPLEIRKQAARKLVAFKKKSFQLKISPFFKRFVNSLCNELLKTNEPSQASLLSRYLEYNDILDKHRRQPMYDYVPELVRLLKSYR